jgi:hypothetical protein
VTESAGLHVADQPIGYGIRGGHGLLHAARRLSFAAAEHIGALGSNDGSAAIEAGQDR